MQKIILDFKKYRNSEEFQVFGYKGDYFWETKGSIFFRYEERYDF